MPRFRLVSAVLVVVAVVGSPALARIKLITLPKRERVEIQLDQPNVTLVKEERVVPLLKGVNQVDFSWANTAIDKDSIQFRALADPEGIKVLSVSYRAKPIEVELRRTFAGDVGFISKLEPVQYDYQTVQFTATEARRPPLRANHGTICSR